MGPGEIIRSSYDAFNRRDVDALREHIHPEFRVDLANSMGFDRGAHHGEAGLRRFFESYWDSFEEITIEVEELQGEGTAVVAIIRAQGRGKGSGAEVDARGPHLWTFRDGMAASLALYGDRDQALRDAERIRAAATTPSSSPAPRTAP
jgi:ketosteroid isomerase-like protein